MQFYHPPSLQFGLTHLDYPMSAVRLGAVVQETKPPKSYEELRVVTDKYGHITGFVRNSSHELILKVLWEDGDTTEVHPSNLILHV